MLAPDEYFYSQFRYDQWKAIRDSDSYSLDHTNHHLEELLKDKKFGTVGAVACDSIGNIAGATSTGGMTNKNMDVLGIVPLLEVEPMPTIKPVQLVVRVMAKCLSDPLPLTMLVASWNIKALVYKLLWK